MIVPDNRMHGSLTEREQMFPGEIVRVTGYMDICEDCGSRFRRMGTGPRAICGRCYPVPNNFAATDCGIRKSVVRT